MPFKHHLHRAKPGAGTVAAVKLVSGYLCIAACWILLSDALVNRLADSKTTMAFLQTVKGLGFIFVTASYLFLLTRQMFNNIQVLSQKNIVAREYLNLALEGSNQVTWHWQLNSGSFSLSGQAIDILHLTSLRSIKTLADWHTHLIPSAWQEFQQSALQYTLEPNGLFQAEVQLQDDKGQTRWLWLRGRLVSTQTEDEHRVVGTLIDTTQRKQQEQRLRQAATVFTSTSEGVMITDAKKRILAVNRAFSEITGYRDSEVIGQTPGILRSGHHDREFYQRMDQSIREHSAWQGEIWNRHKSGTTYPEWLTINAVRDSSGEVTNYVAVFSDISAVKSSEQQLHYLSHYDLLTGLPNRAQLVKELDRMIEESAPAPQLQIALLSLDIDRFRQINQSMGHPYGDKLLTAFTERLRKAIGHDTLLSRFAADQFVIVVQSSNGSRQVARIAERILNTMHSPLWVDGDELFLSVSIGIAFYETDSKSAHMLIQCADSAREQIKRSGGNGFHFFTEEIGRAAKERLSLEADLHKALAKGELVLYYQPQIDLRSRQVVGVEALVRWQHPLQGLLPPGRFLPVADDCGLTAQIDTWALEEACRQSVRWDAMGLLPLRMAVNLSGMRMAQRTLVEETREVIQRTGINPGRLELEVTEDFISSDPESVIGRLWAMRELGVNLAVDDFGTGYSSLSYLKNFPLTHLKIDKSFVDDISQAPESGAIARAIIGLGNVLGLQIIAEGIETEAQCGWLLDHGCREVQGYQFAKPMPAETLQHWLNEYNARLADDSRKTTALRQHKIETA